jgi:hypothetical protein
MADKHSHGEHLRALGQRTVRALSEPGKHDRIAQLREQPGGHKRPTSDTKGARLRQLRTKGQ